MSLLALSPQTQRSVEREKLWEKLCIAREFFLKPKVLKASNHSLRDGSKANYYFDLDYVLNNPYQAEIVLDIYADLINQIRREVSVDFLAFLDKASGGTVGAIRLSAALSIKTNMPNVMVRMGKEISFEKVKAPYLESGLRGLRAVIVSDHCTSGREVVLAAAALRENHATVEHAVVYTIRQDEPVEDRFKAEKIDLRYAFKLPPYDRLPKKPEELEAIAANY